MFGLNFFKRFFQYTFVGFVALGITGWTAFEGAHMWVEHVGMAPDRDEQVHRWEWDRDAEKWSGGDAVGGTNQSLGYKARHAIRSAWMAQNWGTGSSSSVVSSKSGRNGQDSGLNLVDARLEYAQSFLRAALRIAEERVASGSLRPQTLGDLLARHASIMERIGTREALFESRSEFERVWAGLPGKGPDSARVALKLGDLNYRLGDTEDAVSWWTRSLQLTQGDSTESPSSLPAVASTIPSSPSAQRTLISTLVSLSAFYSTSGQLKQAKSLQEASLDLMRSVPSPPNLASASPPQALHSLYVLHRSSLLSIHLAEVMYALHLPKDSSVQYLTQAAESSERVALALAGLPFTRQPNTATPSLPQPPASGAGLVPVYAKSTAMSKPAKSLLRDARRSAAEAWNLIGILKEGSKKPDMEGALDCYERALGWAGVAKERAGGVGEAGEGTLEAEWKVLWANYTRAREAVRKQTEGR
ncbi:hypothetical protein CONPUDRAFT_135011 [Coniophora puteana RWD-64-598 SS2]|uniref:Uncharacterized protein n=1 Tax=Coniophora puteana (strain RWD-64-598) TaxID=741705 RepID=A0A5M3N2U6_CONPW|nr:uncharacterized protein CONPUDRAFT_135011 [Coniophora puteana RWD-64-598 SS2]EIW85195.1 hypothetical protein CONPUDRAFT_135011 [Coniophora puteana RWD-64-598 SS2]